MKEQYRFGNIKIQGEECYVLRIKSSDLVERPIGVYQSITERSSEVEITHNFKIATIIKRDVDTENNHYVWYGLSEYVKNIDRSPGAIAVADQNAANIDYLSMMAGIELPNEIV